VVVGRGQNVAVMTRFCPWWSVWDAVVVGPRVEADRDASDLPAMACGQNVAVMVRFCPRWGSTGGPVTRPIETPVSTPVGGVVAERCRASTGFLRQM